MAIDPRTAKSLSKAAEHTARKRSTAETAWQEQKALMITAHSDGATFEEIGTAVGVTKARAYQVVTGKRSGSAKSDAA